MKSYSLREIARQLKGNLTDDKSADLRIRGVSGIKEASEGEITFLANPRYESFLGTTRASAVIVGKEYDVSVPMIVVPDPYLAFLQVIKMFTKDVVERYPRGIHPTAVIHETASIGSDACIGAYVVIGEGVSIGERATILPHVCICENVSIGDNCLIYPNVTIREGCELGNNVIIHSGAVIGSDGFGYARDGDVHRKIPQVGIVRIEDDVEIGANTTIDRATTGVTLIRRGAKIDNLVQIAHNVIVGENAILAAQVGISGSTEIGRNVVLAGQAGLVGHIKIGDRAMVGAQAGVTKSVPPEAKVSGYPAREHGFSRRVYAATAKLPEVLKEFRNLVKRVEKLESEIADGETTEND